MRAEPTWAGDWPRPAVRRHPLAEAWRLLRRNPLSRGGCLVAAVMVGAAALAPVLAPFPEDAGLGIHPEAVLLPPSSDHPFGTDELGRDLLSRVLFGARISLSVGALTLLLSLAMGVPLGLAAGFSGGRLDDAVMRVTDVFLGFPPLLLAVAIGAVLGPSLGNMVVAIAVSWWPWYTRIVRGQVLTVRALGYVEAARACGAPTPAIVARHVLPNSIAPVIIQASMDFGSVILTAAALGFLGLGARPPTPEWGLMVSTARTYFPDQWWYVTFPGLAIFVTALAFNLLGDGLRELLHPKARR